MPNKNKASGFPYQGMISTLTQQKPMANRVLSNYDTETKSLPRDMVPSERLVLVPLRVFVLRDSLRGGNGTPMTQRVDSLFFSTIVLSKNRPFSLGFRRFSRNPKEGFLGRMGKVDLE